MIIITMTMVITSTMITISRVRIQPTPYIPRLAITENLIIGEAILAKNDHLAQHNRDWFAQRGITALNLMSSPGSGKTSLLGTHHC